MERRQLEFFLAIADAGSFTHAARVLSIAQPSLSYAMRTLEDELGDQLFERHGRGIRLTPAGQALVRPARQTLLAFAQAAGAVHGASEDGFSQLRIVTNTVWALDPLVRVVGQLRQIRPRVRLQISDPASRTVVVEQVRAGEVDFGLVAGEPPREPVSTLHMGDLELVAVLPPGSESGATADLVELAERGLISTPPGTTLRSLLDERLVAAGMDTAIAIETAHVASLVPLVLAGAGAALLPEGMAGEAVSKGARLVRLDPPNTASVLLLWREGALSPAGESLLTLAQNQQI